MYEKCFKRSSNLTDTGKIAHGFTAFAGRKKKDSLVTISKWTQNLEPILNSFNSYGFIKEKKGRLKHRFSRNEKLRYENR